MKNNLSLNRIKVQLCYLKIISILMFIANEQYVAAVIYLIIINNTCSYTS